MFVPRWQPLTAVWPDVNRLQDEFDRVFGRLGGRLPLPRALAPMVAGFPALNLWEDDNNLYVEAELPGVELEDLEIYVNGENQLSIKGERKPPAVEGVTWHRRERNYGSFSRIVELPAEVDPDRVSAEMKHGVLTITLPKKEEAKPRHIQVKAS